ncbi:hypothetical protein PLICBS_009124 [Purpureocillium lilacinum]|uniref:uncharacterized protein n=1 Tax=Purpureocillium lilacinum TaxID=33203 RepID=UPI00208A4AF7|nr:hypothetical protein PLICBS_009124 [Purpureocillium lilacinum]
MASPISLALSNPDDDKSLVLIANTLRDFVNGIVAAAAAARDIDKVIVDECQADDPQPSGWQKYLWNCIGKAAMEIPADHPGQDRLVRLLQELQRLPRHGVPEKVGDEIFQKELWVLTPENKYDGLEQWLWELDQGSFTGTQQVESSEAAATSYVNFSAFLARLLHSEVVEATRLCALIRPSPFATGNPLTSTAYPDASEAAQHYEPWAVAAGQWILHAAEVLYEMGEKETLTEIGRQKWTPALWNGWKSRFAAVANAEEFSSKAREVASKALEKMAEVEREGVTTNVVDTFGFISLKE